MGGFQLLYKGAEASQGLVNPVQTDTDPNQTSNRVTQR